MSFSSTFASGVSEDLLDKFYSTPTSTGLPGPTHVSTQAVLEVLRHDFKNHSPFVNHLKFHNHACYHVLAVYGLGASPELIRDVYKIIHLPMLQPTLVSPGPITEENFTEHLGDEKVHSPIEAIERFIFSPEYNFREKVQPEMLNRLLAGLVHPFIHLAHGLEFGIIGQIVGGLAQAAVHAADQTELIPPSYFTNSATDTNVDLSNLALVLESAGFGTSACASPPEKRPTFAFHRRIRNAASSPVVKSIGGAIHDLVREWAEEWLAGSGCGRWRRRGGTAEGHGGGGCVGELLSGTVSAAGLSRGASGREMNADFFNAHLVTSALFLPKLILKEESSSVSLCGSRTPGLSFATDFYAATETQLFAPAGARAGAGWRQAPVSAWPRVMESGIRFPDEHGPKLARALSDFAARWGTRSAGAPALEGIERLDGTLFLRVAGLTFDRLGWVDEGEKAGHWDRDGFPVLDEYNARKSA
ncbi:hypothetical protein H4582DRAFT_1948603 [Lactarius indigo]|nr:hypothetical protein H4582DRAFT_1948603 [Lactarius indigo]